MDMEEKSEPLRLGAHFLLELASEALADGQYEKGRELVMKAVRQGLILRHLKQTDHLSPEAIERILKAEPEELYEIFAEDEGEESGEESPINGLNYTDIRQSLERLI